MKHEISRRELVKSGLLAGALAPVIALVGNDARAAELHRPEAKPVLARTHRERAPSPVLPNGWSL